MDLGTAGIEGLEEFEDEQGLFSYFSSLVVADPKQRLNP